MRRLPRSARSLALAVLIAAASASTPQTAKAQFVVWDPGNFAQAVTDQVTRIAQYALQGLEYAEAVQGVANLVRQVQQLDDQIAHLRDAAAGRIGPLTSAFSALATADASLLLNVDFGAWRNQLSGTSNALATALGDMDNTSLSDYLLTELNAADVVTDVDLLGLYPGDPARSNQLAADWTEARERADRLRVADLATAEAGGRLFTLLEDAQIDIDGRRGQAQLSHTALQQAQIANQLTAAEIEFARAQLLGIQAQQDAIARHEAELLARQRLAEWFQQEQARSAQLQQFQAAEEARRAAARQWGRLCERPGC